MFDANRKPIDKANSSISYSHDSKEAENYADINALKYNLYKFGIKDIANGDIVTICVLSIFMLFSILHLVLYLQG